MIKQITGKCRECGKELHTTYEHDPENPVPLEWLDRMIGWLTCTECLVRLGRIKVRKGVPAVPDAQTSLPYKD